MLCYEVFGLIYLLLPLNAYPNNNNNIKPSGPKKIIFPTNIDVTFCFAHEQSIKYPTPPAIAPKVERILPIELSPR